MADKSEPTISKGNVIISDSDTDANNLAINSDGSINVHSVVAVAPETATPVIQENFADIATTSGTDTIFTLTNGETLTIQTFAAGSEDITAGSVTELFEDPNGDLSVLNVIEVIFTNGMTTNVPVSQEFVGDGTRRIVMRQRGYTASAREMNGRWQGFEE